MRGRALEWSVRITHELPYYSKASFVTLTYDNDHLPVGGALNKRDLQLYLKRLRKSISPLRIKYFACGEYGSRFGRPHYHAILLGLGVEDADLITKSWTAGYVHVAECNEKTIQYVVGYMSKDRSGTPKDLPKEMQMQSQGLGYRYAAKHQAMLSSRGHINWRGRKVSVPRYYARKLSLSREVAQSYAIQETEQVYLKMFERHGDKLSLADKADIEATSKISMSLALHKALNLLGVYKQAATDARAAVNLQQRGIF